MHRKLLALVAALAIVGVACGPTPAPAPAPAPAPTGVGPGGDKLVFDYSDSYAAIDWWFAPYGAHVVSCAHRIAARESGHYPRSDNGTHHGIFQLHNGFWNSIVAAATGIGHRPNWYDPWQNAWAARAAYASRGTFRVNWAQTVPPGCP